MPAATGLAEEAGPHGVYVRNSFGARASESADLLGFYRGTELLGIAYFGKRGNLIVVDAPRPLDLDEVTAGILESGKPWRIALGSAEIIGRIAARESIIPLVHREQIYYGARAIETLALDDPLEVRRAVRADMKALVQAALELNESDLNVQSWRVNRGWLKDSVKRRIRDGRTFVAGPEGGPTCKVDIGSSGLAGVMLEGVFTVAEARGQRLARRLVAAVAADFLNDHDLVCLHVAADNAGARRAYEAAGMQTLGACSLLLRG